jgi:hypothetical protein
MHSRSPSPQDPVGDHVVHTDLTDMEIAMLDRRLPAWMECSKDKKKDNFEAVCEELRALPYVTTLNRNQWDSRKKVRSDTLHHIMVERFTHSQQYKTWIYNHGQVQAQEALTKYHREWTARAVVMRTKKAEITALIQETKGAKPGEAEMISNYQWAVGQVMAKMTGEELEEAEKEAERWNNERPPLTVQAE